MRRFFYLLFFINFICSSCGQPEVSTNPKVKEYLLETRSEVSSLRVVNKFYQLENQLDQYVIVEFSQPMVSSVGQNTKVDPLEFLPHIHGSFHWLNSKTVLFRPNTSFNGASSIKVSIPSNLVSLYGKTILDKYEWDLNLQGLELVSMIPSPGDSYVDQLPIIQVKFNQAVDLSEIEAFSILKIESISGKKIFPSTHINYSVRYPHLSEINGKEKLRDQIVYFDLKEKLPHQAKVVLEINQKLKAKNSEHTLSKKITHSFTTRDEFKSLGIGCRSYCDPSEFIEIFFNQPVSQDNIKKYIKLNSKNLSSDVKFSYNQEKRALLIFEPNLLPNTTYQLNINSELKNIWGDRIKKDLTYDFSTLPYSPNIKLNHSLENYPISHDNHFLFEAINLDKVQADLYQVKESEFRELYFSSFQRKNVNQFVQDHQAYKSFLIKSEDYISNSYLKFHLNLSNISNKSGLYLLVLRPYSQLSSRTSDELLQNDKYVFLQFSDLNITPLISGDDLWIGAVNHKIKKTQSGVKIRLLDQKGNELKSERTDRNGQSKFDLSLMKENLEFIQANLGKDQFIFPLKAQKEISEDQFFISFHKNFYESGDEVKFQIFFIEKVKPKSHLELIFNSDNDEDSFKIPINLKSNMMRGEFIIPPNLESKKYKVKIKIDNDKILTSKSVLNIISLKSIDHIDFEWLNHDSFSESDLQFNLEVPQTVFDSLNSKFLEFNLRKGFFKTKYKFKDFSFYHQSNIYDFLNDLGSNFNVRDSIYITRKDLINFNIPSDKKGILSHLFFDLDIVDENQEIITKSLSHEINDEFLGVKLNNYFISEGDSFKLMIKMFDRKENPILDRNLKIYVNQIKADIISNFQNIDKFTLEDENDDSLICDLSIKSIPTFCSYKPKSNGWYAFTVFSQHKSGRQLKNIQIAYVYGQDDNQVNQFLIWPQSKQLEKDEYHFLIFNPYQEINLWALSKNDSVKRNEFFSIDQGIIPIKIKSFREKVDKHEIQFLAQAYDQSFIQNIKFQYIKDDYYENKYRLNLEGQNYIFYPQQKSKINFIPNKIIEKESQIKTLFFLRDQSRGERRLSLDNIIINKNDLVSKSETLFNPQGYSLKTKEIWGDDYLDILRNIFNTSNKSELYETYQSYSGEISLDFEAPHRVGDYQGIVLFQFDESRFLIKSFDFKVKSDVNLLPEFYSYFWSEDEVNIPIQLRNYSDKDKIITLDFNINDELQYSTIELPANSKENTYVRYLVKSSNQLTQSLSAQDEDQKYSVSLDAFSVLNPNSQLISHAGVIDKEYIYDVDFNNLKSFEKISYFISRYPYSLLIDQISNIEKYSKIDGHINLSSLLTFLDSDIKNDIRSFFVSNILNNNKDDFINDIKSSTSKIRVDDLLVLAEFFYEFKFKDKDFFQELKSIIEDNLNNHLLDQKLESTLKRDYIYLLLGNDFEGIHQKIISSWENYNEEELAYAFRILCMIRSDLINGKMMSYTRQNIQNLLDSSKIQINSNLSKKFILSLWLKNLVMYDIHDKLITEIISQLMAPAVKPWSDPYQSYEIVLSLNNYISKLKSDNFNSRVMLQKDKEVGFEYLFDEQSPAIVEKYFNRSWLSNNKKIYFRIEGDGPLFFQEKFLFNNQIDRNIDDHFFVQQSQGLYSYFSGIEGTHERVQFNKGEEVTLNYLINVSEKTSHLILRDYFPTGWHPLNLDLKSLKVDLYIDDEKSNLINYVSKIDVKNNWADFHIDDIDSGIYLLKYKGRFNISGKMVKPQSFLNSISQDSSLAFDKKYWIYIEY